MPVYKMEVQQDATLIDTVPHMEYRASKRRYLGIYQPAYPGTTRLLFVLLLFLWGLESAGFSGDTLYLNLAWRTPRDDAISKQADVVIFLLSILLLVFITTSYHIAAGIHLTYVCLLLMMALTVVGLLGDALADERFTALQHLLMLVYLLLMLFMVIGHFVLKKAVPALHRGKFPLIMPRTSPRGVHDVSLPNMARWDKVLPGPLAQQTLDYQTHWARVLPRCFFAKKVMSYKGQVDEAGRPHGLGEWNTDLWNGEHLHGMWHRGVPIAPFNSREVGSYSSIRAHRVAYVQCRPETDPFKADAVPSWTPQMRWGVGSVESCASGVFFHYYPYVTYMTRAQFLGSDDVEDAASQGPFLIPDVRLSTEWQPCVYEDLDLAFGVVPGAGDVEGGGGLPDRDTKWMQELLQGLSPPEGGLLDPETSWADTGSVSVYVDGEGQLGVTGHVERGAALGSPQGGSRSLRIRLVERDLRQMTLQAVPCKYLPMAARPLVPAPGEGHPLALPKPSHRHSSWTAAIQEEEEGDAAEPHDQSATAQQPSRSACLKVEGWVPRSRVGAYEALLFVHGYNAWPANSMEKLGQLLALGNFPTYIKPILFQWPAAGGSLLYPLARQTARSRQVVHAFMEVLRALQAEGVTAVHIVGHSMGARVVVAVAPAMQHGYRKGYLQLACESITLLQPEQDLRTFCESGAACMRSFCPIVTVYGNSKDGALGPAEYMSALLDAMERNFPYWALRPLPAAKADRRYAEQHGMGKKPARLPTPLDSGSATHAAGATHNGNGSTAQFKPIHWRGDGTILNVAEYNTTGAHAVAAGNGCLPRASRARSTDAGLSDTWWFQRMLGRAVGVGEVQDPKTGHLLDVDIVNTTYVQANVHQLRHTFFHLNREVVADLRDIIASKRRARQRTSRLELIGGNVYGFLVAPTYVLNP